MGSKIELNNMNAKLLEEASLTLPPNKDAFKTVSITSTTIDVSGSSAFNVTPDLIELNSIDLTVSGNSKALINATDDMELQANCNASFTVSAIDPADRSQIEINNLDFLNDDYTKVTLVFNFDTTRAQNFGKFIFPGVNNGNAFACSKLFDLGFVHVDGQRAQLDFRKFTADYSNNALTISLKNRGASETSED